MLLESYSLKIIILLLLRFLFLSIISTILTKFKISYIMYLFKSILELFIISINYGICFHSKLTRSFIYESYSTSVIILLLPESVRLYEIS